MTPIWPRRAGRRWQRLLAFAACLGVLLLSAVALAAPASAHASLLFTTPAVGTSTPTSPAALVLVFDEHVTLPPQAVSLASASGATEQLASPSLSHGGTTLTATLARPLPDGAFTVHWQVISADGDAVSGSYQFAVGTAATGSLSGGAATSAAGVSWPTALARWIQFGALALLLGPAALRRALGDGGIHPDTVPRPWDRPAAAIGLLASLALTGLIAGDNSLSAALTHPSTSALTSRPGLIAVTEAAAFAASLLLSLRWRRWAWVPAVVVVIAEALRAHPGQYASSWGELVTAAHVTAAAIWIGALAEAIRYLSRAHRAGRPGRPVITGYAALAAWAFATVIASGITATLIIVPWHAWTSTDYGWTLLAKLVLVAVAAGYALASRRRLATPTPRIRHLRVEAGTLIVILAAGATLTATPPPRPVTTALPIPPPPAGPLVYLGDRTGQIGITLAASTGQAVIHLFAPSADDPTDQDGEAHYRLAATRTAPSRPAEKLALRSCGTGCFVAGTHWQAGTNELSLNTSARGWTGGTITLAVPWPPHPDPAALTRLANLLRDTGAMTDYERITSNTTTGPGTINPIKTTGPRFLAVEPYAHGRAAAVNSVTRPDGTSTLYIADPGENIYARIDLDARGRPLHESLTDPDHLITRSFTYPETPDAG